MWHGLVWQGLVPVLVTSGPPVRATCAALPSACNLLCCLSCCSTAVPHCTGGCDYPTA